MNGLSITEGSQEDCCVPHPKDKEVVNPRSPGNRQPDGLQRALGPLLGTGENDFTFLACPRGEGWPLRASPLSRCRAGACERNSCSRPHSGFVASPLRTKPLVDRTWRVRSVFSITATQMPPSLNSQGSSSGESCSVLNSGV